MMLALQVLLIHLIELSKVDELCKDFCSRYITTLKQQQETEKLARLESEEGLQLSEASPPAGSVATPGGSTTTGQTPKVVAGSGTVFQMIQTPNGLVATPIQVPVLISG